MLRVSYIARRNTASSSKSIMSDGRNEARVLRLLELANDIRTLAVHINSYLQRATAQPPDSASQPLIGYVLLRECDAKARALSAIPLAPPMSPGGDTDEEKAKLIRLNYKFSAHRFKSHSIYLRVAAATRWTQTRAQVLKGGTPQPAQAAALRQIDDRLRQEIVQITDESVYRDLKNADVRHGYWLDEDPNLPKIQALIRQET